MKTDNLFRFVAVRPPQMPKKPEEPTNRLKGDDASSKEIIEQLNKRPEWRRAPEKARLAVGRDLINSRFYFRVAKPTRTLVEATEKAQTLLQSVRNDADFCGFRDAGLTLLAPVNPASLTLDAFLDSRDYQTIKQSLWRSYYASVLNPYERPSDREVITPWLLLFYLLESESEEQFKARAKHLGSTRPAVPFMFFAPAAEPEYLPRPQQRPEVQNLGRLKELEGRIANLRDSRRALQDLFVTKLRTIERVCSSIEQPLATAEWIEGPPHEEVVDEQSPAIAKQPKERLRSAIVTSRRCVTNLPPWRVTDEDLDGNTEAFQVVRDLGLVTEVTPLPDLISRLDGEIATLNAEAYRLKTRDEIMLVGKTFVRVRRPLFYAADAEEDIQ